LLLLLAPLHCRYQGDEQSGVSPLQVWPIIGAANYMTAKADIIANKT
jgi:hypothetical protein